MNAWVLILLGVILILGGVSKVLSEVPIQKAEVSAPLPQPKTNDHRIVKMSDGTYRIQYYWGIPGWISFQSKPETLEQAQALLKAIEKKHDEPSILEEVKSHP